MKISEVATLSGVSAKTIRYYESIGLIESQRMAHNGYRIYETRHIHILKFLNKARGLGFSVKQCQELLSLYGDKDRASADVKDIAEQHLNDIRTKIDQLNEIYDTLSHLVQTCHGDSRPDCPILKGIADLDNDKREE